MDVTISYAHLLTLVTVVLYYHKPYLIARAEQDRKNKERLQKADARAAQEARKRKEQQRADEAQLKLQAKIDAKKAEEARKQAELRQAEEEKVAAAKAEAQRKEEIQRAEKLKQQADAERAAATKQQEEIQRQKDIQRVSELKRKADADLAAAADARKRADAEAAMQESSLRIRKEESLETHELIEAALLGANDDINVSEQNTAPDKPVSKATPEQQAKQKTQQKRTAGGFAVSKYDVVITNSPSDIDVPQLLEGSLKDLLKGAPPKRRNRGGNNY